MCMRVCVITTLTCLRSKSNKSDAKLFTSELTILQIDRSFDFALTNIAKSSSDDKSFSISNVKNNFTFANEYFCHFKFCDNVRKASTLLFLKKG